MEIQTSSYTFTSESTSLSSIYDPNIFDNGPYSIYSNGRTVTVEWGRKIFKETRNFTYKFDPNTIFKETLVPSCSVDNTIDFNFTVTTLEGQAIPGWIQFNSSAFTLSGTTPELKYGETYSFQLISNWTEIPFTYTNQTITIEVEGLILPATTAGTIAIATIQGQIAVVGLLSIVTSVLNESSPTSFWAIVNQLQVILLMLLIDDYTPEDINKYIEELGFMMFNFNFLPFEETPGISIATDWLEFGEPFDKVEKLGLDSLSTFINNISLIITFIGLFILHMTLKLSVC